MEEKFNNNQSYNVDFGVIKNIFILFHMASFLISFGGINVKTKSTFIVLKNACSY